MNKPNFQMQKLKDQIPEPGNKPHIGVTTPEARVLRQQLYQHFTIHLQGQDLPLGELC